MWQDIFNRTAQKFARDAAVTALSAILLQVSMGVFSPAVIAPVVALALYRLVRDKRRGGVIDDTDLLIDSADRAGGTAGWSD